MMYLSETFPKVDTKANYFFIFMLFLFLLSLTINNSFAVPADTIEVVAKHPESSARSIYQINFVVSKPIPPKAIIRISFPDEFDLSGLMIVGSTTINGGFEMNVEKQVLIIKRSGLGREIPANEKVDVKFAIIKNPKQPADDYKIVVEILDENNKDIVKQEKFQKVLPQKE